MTATKRIQAPAGAVCGHCGTARAGVGAESPGPVARLIREVVRAAVSGTSAEREAGVSGRDVSQDRRHGLSDPALRWLAVAGEVDVWRAGSVVIGQMHVGRVRREQPIDARVRAAVDYLSQRFAY